MFDLENAIKTWKNSLHKNPSLEDGYIEELESHFRDKVEDYTNKGMNEEEAFEKTIKEIGNPEKIGVEFFKTDNKVNNKKNIWNERAGILILATNYFKIAFRMLRKYKSYSFINIAGFTLGFTCFVLIAYFVKFQLSFDQFHKNKNNLYRLVTTEFAKVPEPWAPALRNDFPEVKNFVRLQRFGQVLIEYKNDKFYDSHGFYADSSFFDIFSFRLIEGNPNTALTAPYSIVITKEQSEKIFGKIDAIGKTITINDDDNKQEYKVTGVVENVPLNSHFTFSFLVSESTNKAPWINNWKWDQFYTYLLLDKNADVKDLTAKINPWLKKKIDDPNWDARIELQPLTSIHLHSHLERELEVNPSMSTIYIFSVVGILILLIAIVNYINLTTARAVNRAKEVALRKSMGAKRVQLIFQFIGETIIYSIIVFIISVFVVELLIPEINSLFQLNLNPNFLSDSVFILELFVAIIAVGILSGIYPAFVLSAFQPTSIFKGISKGSNKNILKRTILIFQFGITSFLIISSLLIYKQMQYVNSKDIGFNSNEVITFPISSKNIKQNINAFRNELRANPNVLLTSYSANLPGGSDWGVPYQAEGINDADVPSARLMPVDQDFITTYKMKVIEGRNFDRKIKTDKDAYIINETAAKKLGWSNPLSKKLAYKALDRNWGNIVGVVKDFNYRSLHQKVAPLIMFIPPGSWYSNISIKIKKGEISNTITYIKDVWKKFDSEHPFTFSFINEDLNDLYISDQRNMQIISILTAIAIFISCLGLYSMMIHTLTNRTKEIGIRKILGANVSRIVRLVSKEYLVLIIIADLLACPVAYHFLKGWLEDFAYRVSITPIIFLIGCIVSFAIAFITIIYKIIKAANANPANSLRYE